MASKVRRRSPCIIGLGQTEFSVRSGRSELQLALEAITAAVGDAGLDVGDIDGLIRYTWDTTSEATLINVLGLRSVRYHSLVNYGGIGCCATLAHAAAAIDAGIASCVLIYRSLNARSGVRFGRAERHLEVREGGAVVNSDELPSGPFTAPFGLLAPAQYHALYARRYFAEYGIDDQRGCSMLGEIAVTQRAFANENPRALFHDRPLTHEMYQGSRMIAEPLRLYDVCLETDGAMALLVASPELAARAAPPPVEILAAGQAAAVSTLPMVLYSDSLHSLAPEWAGRDLFGRAGLAPQDVDVAAIYDATSILVPIALEDFGFVERGGAAEFVLSGQTGRGGSLPTNTHGGLLSEGYFHGLNTIGEAVRQLRRESFNQVPDAATAFVTVRGASSALLGRR
jgi:acetyl-CoA acetyltransferase